MAKPLNRTSPKPFAGFARRLGYPQAKAERVIGAACDEAGEDASTESLIRAALHALAS